MDSDLHNTFNHAAYHGLPLNIADAASLADSSVGQIEEGDESTDNDQGLVLHATMDLVASGDPALAQDDVQSAGAVPQALQPHGPSPLKRSLYGFLSSDDH